MKRSVPERVAAWLLTGPIGHLVAGAIDWVAVLAPHARERLGRSVRRRAR